MSQISVINFIQVPENMDEEAVNIRTVYVDYFRKQKGFVSSTFYKSITSDKYTNYVNIVVWESYESFQKVVNAGFDHIDGMNNDGFKVLGKGFPEPILVTPGQFTIIGN